MHPIHSVGTEERKEWEDETVQISDFFLAAKLGLESTVRDGLRALPQWARQSSEGHTALHMAILYGQAQCVELLLPYSDTSQLTPNGLDALQLASLGGFVQCVRLVLAALKVQPWSLNGSGLEANVPALQNSIDQSLRLATKKDNVDCVDVLRAYASPNATSRTGLTALMFAAHAGFLGCVRLLATAQTAPLKTREGSNALSMALHERHFACADHLLDFSTTPLLDARMVLGCVRGSEECRVPRAKAIVERAQLEADVEKQKPSTPMRERGQFSIERKNANGAMGSTVESADGGELANNARSSGKKDRSRKTLRV